jgi:hypothetical protein
VNIKRDNSLQSCGLLTGPIGNVAAQVDVSLLSGSYAGMLLRAKGDQFYIFGIQQCNSARQGEKYLAGRRAPG